MDKALAQSIGQAARAARISLQLTQEDAAERIGVSVEFYSRIERGAALPSLQTFVRMSYVLDVSSDVMIGRRTAEPGGVSPKVVTSLLPQAQEERPEVRRVLRRLRTASSGTLRFVALLLKEIDRTQAGNKKDDEE
ncbi:helix-turn-helix domain-containing protein [Haliangium sp.]|uniref:helix-turn-helix domain-containing protein n=1 Tax=Haliangium sp. TaxID=2663208 RepID=UPI003D11FFC3